jgi:hypothetical protein
MDRKAALVCRKSDRFDTTDSSDCIQNLPHIAERHPQLAQGDGSEFVQDLNADGAPLGEQLLDSVRFVGILRKQVQQYAGIEK